MAAKDKNEQIANLEQRVAFLENANRSYQLAMDLASNMVHLHGRASFARNPAIILNDASQAVRRLMIKFKTVSFFLVNEEDSLFYLSLCDPQDNEAEILKEKSLLIRSGQFAWAINLNNAMIVQSKVPQQRLLLHVMATRTRVRGMFLGVIDEDTFDLAVDQKFELSSSHIYLLSIIFHNIAYALESAELYRLMDDLNQSLETKIKEKTFEIDLNNRRLEAKVDELTRMEAELRRHRNELELLVQERTADLQKAYCLADASNQAKSDFLANMSHEIRTPMNAIVGFSDLALQMDMPPKMRDYIAKIAQSSQSLLRIINDILDFSKIEAGKLDLEISEFLMRDIFTHMADMFRAKVTEKHIELIMCISEECQYELLGDSLRLEQVLLNLIGNALKFTEEGEIEVKVTTVRETAHQVVLKFCIRDTGIGMEEEQLDKLFSAFTQADSSITRKFGGTGLGLSISKKLVEMMGGRLWATSKFGQGSVFHFTATFQRKLGGELEDMVPPEDMERLKALVVDDNAAARNAMQISLNMFNFATTAVSSGQEAILAIQQGIAEGSPYQLALIDWLMPEMDGIQTIRQLNTTILPEVFPKAILLIPYDREEYLRSLGDEAGVNAYLAKPVNCSILFDTIMNVFGRDVVKVFRKDVIDTREIMERIGGARVLLVDDNAINRQVAMEILEAVGLVVEMAHDGMEAITRITESAYDIVLMDIQMPGVDGYQASRQIRSMSQFNNMPIIAMTAHAMAGDREKCLNVGMNDHIAKPIDRKQLYCVLMEWIIPRTGLGLVTPLVRDLVHDEACIYFPSTLPGIDIHMALERLNGNCRLYRSILREFYLDYAQSAHHIRDFLTGNQRNGRLAAQLVHTVKGIAGNIAAVRLHNATLALEQGMNHTEEEQLILIDYFEKALNEVVSSIETLKQLEETVQPKEEVHAVGQDVFPLEMDKIVPIILELTTQIQGMEFKSQESFNRLKPILNRASKDVIMELQHLEEQLERIDFDGAMTSLSTMAKLLGIEKEPS